MRSMTVTRPILGWALYDFANSAYSTTIVTVLFSVYFVRALVPSEGVSIFGILLRGEAVWSFLVTSVMGVVIVTSPFLGALADQSSSKRKFLLTATLVGAVGTMALFWAKPGWLGLGVGFGFVSFLAYELCQIFYNAFLKDVSTTEDSGRVSGLGFAFGYIGGGVCLLFNLWMMKSPGQFGLAGGDGSLPLRASFLMVGVWWLLFSIPTFLWVREKRVGQGKGRDPSIYSGTMAELKDIFIHARREKNVGRFLLAYFIYNDGIQTLLIMSSIVGAQLTGMDMNSLALCFLTVQFVAFLGAVLFGWLADVWSHKKAIMAALGVYFIATVWAAFIRQPWEFWVLGIVIGVVLGGSQSASRSLYANMVPADKANAFFSFFAVVGKAAAFLGPLMFGVMTQTMGVRFAVAFLAVFYLAGGVLLWGVREGGREIYKNN